MPLTDEHAERFQRYEGRLTWANRALIWVVPLLALVAAADAASSLAALHRIPQPAMPNLEALDEPFAPIPAAELSPSVFDAPQGAQEERAPLEAAPVEEARQWKLKGVLLGGAARRAFLQDAQGKERVWVTEGQRVGGFRIKEIREKSVLIEKDGTVDEIRL